MSGTVTLKLSVREARRLALMLRLHSEQADKRSVECLDTTSGLGNKAYRQWRRSARKAHAMAGDIELAARDAESGLAARVRG